MGESIGLLDIVGAVYLIAAHVVGLEHVGANVEVDVVLLGRQVEDCRLL